MTRISFSISWPPHVLSSNARVHWAERAKVTSKHRQEARIAAIEAGARKYAWRKPRVVLTYHPPVRKGPPPDVQNVNGALKAAIDGLEDALRINDRHFEIYYPPRHAEREGAGRVIVEISEAGDGTG